jgi:hypothetical protein
VQGREITAYFVQGPTLELYVGTRLETRMGVSTREQIESLEKNGTAAAVVSFFPRDNPVSLADPELDGISAFGIDEHWIARLLSDPQVKVLIPRLLQAAPGWAMTRSVDLRPRAFRFFIHGNINLIDYMIEPHEVRQWVDDLLELARIAEDLPVSEIKAEESRFELMLRTGKVSYRRAFFVITGFILAVALIIVTLGLLLGGK